MQPHSSHSNWAEEFKVGPSTSGQNADAWVEELKKEVDSPSQLWTDEYNKMMEENNTYKPENVSLGLLFFFYCYKIILFTVLKTLGDLVFVCVKYKSYKNECSILLLDNNMQ